MMMTGSMLMRQGMKRTALVLAAGIVLAACGSDEVTVAQNADGKVTKSSDGTINVTTTDGASATIVTEGGALSASSAKVAETLPAFAPLYPGAKVISTMTGSDAGGGSGSVVVLESADSLADITAFYDGRIAASGVKQQMKMDQDGSAMRAVGNADGKSGAMISISDGGDARTISITVGGEG